jgi:hypothetical protein
MISTTREATIVNTAERQENKHGNKEVYAFRRKGEVMVQVWKDKKICGNDKYDP